VASTRASAATAGYRVALPFDALRPRGVTHVQRSALRLDENRTSLGRSRDAVLVLAGGNRQRIAQHQRAHVRGILVAQPQVRDLVVEQCVLATCRGTPDAMEQHRANAPLGRILIAVGVPADRPVRVGDELAAPRLAGHRHPAQSVVIGKEVAVEPREAELPAERAQDARFARADAAGVHDQVGAPNRGESAARSAAVSARVADPDGERRASGYGPAFVAPAP
jgi:hypothetical protein